MSEHDAPPPGGGYPPPGAGSGYGSGYGSGLGGGYGAGSGYGQQPHPPHGHHQQPRPHQPSYQPGTVPLRPLFLGDIYNGAFQTMRRNPRATVGTTALVTTVFMVVPTLVTVVLAVLGVLPPIIPDLDTLGTSQEPPFTSAISVIGTFGSSFFQWLATVVVTGMLVHVVAGAAVGHRWTAGQAWQATRPRLLRLVGLSLLNGAVALLVLGIPAAVLAAPLALIGAGAAVAGAVLGLLLGGVALVVVTVRYFLLAPCVLMLEGTGVLASLRRSGELVSGMFWRVLGIYLLAVLIAGTAGQVISVPLAVIGVVAAFVMDGSSYGTMAVLLSSNLSVVLVGALTTPFTAGTAVLQYLDARIRREGFDVVLLTQAQEAAPTPGQTAGPPGPR